MTRLCIVPRWSGGPDSDFYPWLRAQPGVRARIGELLSPAIAQPGQPTIAAWVESLQQSTAGSDLGSTYFLGHSVGCQAVLRFLEQSSDNARVAGVLCVAGWWTVDRPWDSIRPWIETPMDLDRVRRVGQRFSVLLSDDDPFTADWRENERQWRERLGADVRCVPGGKHFNAAEEPAVLAALYALIDSKVDGKVDGEGVPPRS
jgi:predicted alpha/beta hydrolase family esterase